MALEKAVPPSTYDTLEDGAGYPRLPAAGGGKDAQQKALHKTLFMDRDTGEFYWKTMDGEWVSIPLDEAGLPMYDIPDYVAPKAANNGD